jgi:hypothetical protein
MLANHGLLWLPNTKRDLHEPALAMHFTLDAKLLFLSMAASVDSFIYSDEWLGLRKSQ